MNRPEVEKNILAFDAFGYSPRSPGERHAKLSPLLDGGRALLNPEHRKVYNAVPRLGESVTLDLLAKEAEVSHSLLSDLEDRAENMTEAQAIGLAKMLAEDAEMRAIGAALVQYREAIQKGEDERTAWEALEQARTAAKAISPSRRDRLIVASEDLSGLAQRYEAGELAEPRGILGDLFAVGDFAMLIGREGLGKTFLLLLLLLALMKGKDFFGHPTGGPLKVGLVSPELGQYRLAKRWHAIVGDDDNDGPGFPVLHKDNMPTGFTLSDETCRQELVAFADAYELDLLALDPLSRLHAGELWGESFAPTRLFFQDFATLTKTGAALLLTHHENVAVKGSNWRDHNARQYGDKRLSYGMPFGLCLFERQGKICLDVSKANHGPQWSPIWLERTETGTFRTTDGPQDMKEKKAEREGILRDALQELEKTGTRPTTEWVQATLGLKSRGTVSAYMARSGYESKKGPGGKHTWVKKA